jgi:hypothetical protein
MYTALATPENRDAENKPEILVAWCRNHRDIILSRLSEIIDNNQSPDARPFL